MKQHSTLFLIGLILLGWSVFSAADILVKHLSSFYGVSQILMIGSFISASLTALVIIFHKGPKGFKSEKLKWHVLRALIVVGISYNVVTAFSKMPLADVYGIVFTAPFITLILIYFFLHEPIGIQRWTSVIVGFIGAIILIGPQFETLNNGVFFACAAAFFIGSSAVAIRKIGKGEYLPLYAFYPLIAIFIFNAPMGLANFIMPDLSHIWLLLAHALCVFSALFMTTYAIAYVKEAAILSPFLYIQIIWGVIFGYLLFGDIPSQATIIGLVLIIGAGLYSIWREHVNYKKSQSL